MFFDIKKEMKKLLAMTAYIKFLDEVIRIVHEEYPEIVIKATIQTVDKNPELFKDALEKVKKDE